MSWQMTRCYFAKFANCWLLSSSRVKRTKTKSKGEHSWLSHKINGSPPTWQKVNTSDVEKERQTKNKSPFGLNALRSSYTHCTCRSVSYSDEDKSSTSCFQFSVCCIVVRICIGSFVVVACLSCFVFCLFVCRFLICLSWLSCRVRLDMNA